MQQFLNNRYVRMTALTLGLGLLFFGMLWMIFTLVGLNDFPVALEALVAFLGAGFLVTKFLSNRIS